MELKVDRTRLLTVQNYSKKFNISRPTIYTKMKSGELKRTEIDGVTFVQL